MKCAARVTRCLVSGLLAHCILIQVVWAAGTTGKANVVYVGSSPSVFVKDGAATRSPTLLRELARQALLIAARDELGLETRDAWLGSQMPSEGHNAPFQLVYGQAAPDTLEIVRGFSPPAPLVYQRWTVARGDRLGSAYLPVLIDLELASRTTFVQVLQNAGFQSRAKPPAQPATGQKPVDEVAFAAQTEERLLAIDMFSQFAAARALHAEIHRRGESAQLLGQLVRAYANLGALTEFHWHPGHKVFKARALLYAQRMVSHYGDASAFEHRAYAQALCGLHAAALASFMIAANQAPASDQDNGAWVALVYAYCHLDKITFSKAVNEAGQSQLATLLRFFLFEQHGSTQDTITYGLQAATEIPDCFRIHDAVCRLAGVGAAHQATAVGPQILVAGLHDRLAAMRGVPEEAVAAAQTADIAADGENAGIDWRAPAKVIAALQHYGDLPSLAKESGAAKETEAAGSTFDVAELRWETLGVLLRELCWTQIRRRAYFERNQLGVDGDAWLDSAKPVTDLHPYSPLMGQYRWSPAAQNEARREAAKLQPVGLEVQAGELGLALSNVDPAKASEFVSLAFRNTDDTAFELLQSLSWIDQERTPRRAARLLAVAPYSPLARSILVERNFDDYSDQAYDWQDSAAQSPALALAFGKLFVARHDYDKAEAMLRSAIEQSHEKSAYLALADLYERQHDDGKWLATLQDFLRQPTFGLEHTDINSKISRRFIQRHDWQGALPFAEAAAETYALRGLHTAAVGNEALRNWKAAEAYFRASSERYRSDRLSWYSFCRRTGQGDRPAARKLALPMAEEMLAADPRNWKLGTFYLLDGQTELAFKFFSTQPGPDEAFASMLAAFLADELQDTRQRDAMLRKVAETKRGPNLHLHEALITLAKIFVADLALGGTADFDVGRIERRCPINDPTPLCDYHYFLGCYLARCGKLALAIDQWKRALACEDVQGFSRILAGIKLSELMPPDSYPNPIRMATGLPQAVDFASARPPAPRKLQAPGDAALQAALVGVKSLFAQFYQRAGNPGGMTRLAEQLVATGPHQAELTKQFAMLGEARRLATAAGRMDIVARSIQLLDGTFVVDKSKLYNDTFQEISTNNWSREQWLTNCSALAQAVDLAIVSEDFRLASQLLESAQAAAEKSGDAGQRELLAIRLQELRDREDRFNQFTAVEKTLLGAADNQSAHTVVGSYLAFDRDQWAAASAHWRRGEDPALKELAELEARPPQNAQGALDLANRWWKFAQNRSGVAHTASSRRAGWWRERAQVEAKGLTRLKAARPLDETADRQSPVNSKSR